MSNNSPPKFFFVKSKVFNLYLTGLRGIVEGNKPHKYNNGKKLLFLGGTVLGLKWFMHKAQHVSISI